MATVFYLNGHKMTLNVQTEIGTEQKDFHLRITAGGQKKLKEKYKNEILSLIMSSVSDTEILFDIFDTALKYPNNNNIEITGEEFYDLLVDNGICGQAEMSEVVFQIAEKSGILNNDQQRKVSKSIKATYDGIFNHLEDEMNVEKLFNDDSEEKIDNTFRKE